MKPETLYHFESPQLPKIHAGKVRDSIALQNKKRLIVVTDRISAFNKNLKNAIPYKGAVLNKISNFWFKKTEHIIENHLITQVDDQINLVKECTPIKVEMVVRGYIAGSIWRGYQDGQRNFCGVDVVDGMHFNQKFPNPILTPTTKDKDDTEISEEEIIARDLVDFDTYQKMKEISLKLYDFGSKFMAERGIILVDTKYEFGLYEGKLILIDEIHTPDSSRYWYQSDYEKNPEKAEQIDKEFVRQWMLANKIDGEIPLVLSNDIVNEASRRYREIYEKITAEKFKVSEVGIKTRMYYNLLKNNLIQKGFVQLIIDSEADRPFAENWQKQFHKENFSSQITLLQPHQQANIIDENKRLFDNSLEPTVVVCINKPPFGLGQALILSWAVPVINTFNTENTKAIEINLLPQSALYYAHPEQLLSEVKKLIHF